MSPTTSPDTLRWGATSLHQCKQPSGNHLKTSSTQVPTQTSHKRRHTTAWEHGRRRGGAARKGSLSPRLDPFTPRQHTSAQAGVKGIRQQ